MTGPVTLPVRCPICDALPGEPCEDIVRGGWITARATPHMYRVQAAAEDIT